MIKRVFLFLLTNIAVMVLLWIIIFIVERFFWIAISWYWQNYISILIYAWIVWFTWAFFSLFISRWSAKKVYNIILIDQNDLYNLSAKKRLVYDVVFDLAQRNGIKVPEVWIYESSEPNAFATGATKNSSLVAVSTWLLDLMNEKELKWVIGHEMAHILNWDMVTMTLLQWVINTFVVFLSRIIANIADSYFRKDDSSEWASWIYYVVSIVLDILLWILASIIVMWFSRVREFRADEWSAKFVWKENMIAWLEALKKVVDKTEWDDSKLSTMKISTRTKWWLMALFSSHPDLDDRIENLKNFTY